jgi:hypothetical protein
MGLTYRLISKKIGDYWYIDGLYIEKGWFYYLPSK